ncbi:MAG: hypothetical protein ACYC1F_10455 [Gallionellaceae bacterium]
MSQSKITLHAYGKPLSQSLKLLAKVAKRSPDSVRAFLDGLESTSELVRIDNESFAAAGASHSFLVFYPSKRLLDFFAATFAGESDDV